MGTETNVNANQTQSNPPPVAAAPATTPEVTKAPTQMTTDAHPTGTAAATPPPSTEKPAAVAGETPPAAAAVAPEKKEEAPPAAVPEKKVAPEKYEFKVPEGSKLKATAVERIERIARDQGLSQNEAQQLLAQEHEAVSEYQKSVDAELASAQAKLKTELENDPEVGGAKLRENSEIVRRALEANFSKEAIEFVDKSGIGNSKVFFKDLLRLGKRLQQSEIIPSNGAPPPPKRKPDAEVFYPKKDKET